MKTLAPPGLNLLRLEEDLSAAHLRLASAYIERLDWAGAWIVTIARIRCSIWIRRVFDGFHIETVPIQYTVGLEAASRHEVIISNWDVGAEPAGLF